MLMAFAINSSAPLILEVSHENPLVSVISIVPMASLTAMIYYYIKFDWNEGGLYSYSFKISPTLGKIQIYTWVLSYFLYIVYTADYISFYVLNLPILYSYLLTILLPIITSILVLTDFVYLVLIGTAAVQLLLSIPITWNFSVNFNSEEPSYLFSNILSSSLLLICLTLTTYLKGERKYANVVIYAFLISSFLLVVGGFFMPSNIVLELSAISDFSLILVEYKALHNLFNFIGVRQIIRNYIIPLLVILFTSISIINYKLFYSITTAPSFTALFISVLIPSIIFPFYKRGIGYILSIINSGLMVYGVYEVTSSFHGIYFYDSVIPPLIAILIPLLQSYSKR